MNFRKRSDKSLSEDVEERLHRKGYTTRSRFESDALGLSKILSSSVATYYQSLLFETASIARVGKVRDEPLIGVPLQG